MNDLCDTWSVDQKWSIVPVNNKNDDDLGEVWFAGSTCDSDDFYKGKMVQFVSQNMIIVK